MHLHKVLKLGWFTLSHGFIRSIFPSNVLHNGLCLVSSRLKHISIYAVCFDSPLKYFCSRIESQFCFKISFSLVRSFFSVPNFISISLILDSFLGRQYVTLYIVDMAVIHSGQYIQAAYINMTMQAVKMLIQHVTTGGGGGSWRVAHPEYHHLMTWQWSADVS